ncbi:hypothetical protein RFI_02944 [Reticulomyxa filosa]|uniref:Uncharacterized protein n=1 Tax=Reticulomyxa filosa TaxID=46433 RepID=X6P6I9_RETFI|nr:hypothetical protein RFI_02944 [Reticulomyxa filosa]|eukprot:ETO34150.1 hypothetical protein RFI_02944 [Reticulomyxa filosa]
MSSTTFGVVMENLLNIKKTDSSSEKFLASQHMAYMKLSKETDAKRKIGQVQEINYSEQKEAHKMNQRALETTFVKSRKEAKDKICFGFQCKYRNWLKVKLL